MVGHLLNLVEPRPYQPLPRYATVVMSVQDVSKLIDHNPRVRSSQDTSGAEVTYMYLTGVCDLRI